MKTKPTIHGITTNRLPEVKKGKYSDGHPLDTVQYLECKIILKGDRFTAESNFDDFAKIVKRTAEASTWIFPARNSSTPRRKSARCSSWTRRASIFTTTPSSCVGASFTRTASQ